MRHALTFLWCLWALLVLAACDEQHSAQQSDIEAAPYIVAVNNPLLYFARRLAGDEIEVRMLAPAEGDPAQWRPDVEDVLQLQGAELVLLNGAGYSPWLDKVSLASRKLVLTSGTDEQLWIPLEKQVTHSHGPQGEHAHGDYAFTTWLDMSLAQSQAQTVAEALVRKWPALRERVASELAQLLGDLQALDTAYRNWAESIAGRQVIYSHPVYQYFERRYELPGHSLHWEPHEMPAEAQWQALAAIVSGNAVFVWEAEPAPAISERLQQLGVEQVVLDPGANVGDVDWLAVQQNNIGQLNGRQ